MTKRDGQRKAFDRRHGVAQDIITMVLVRWIAVAAVLLGIAALAYADDTCARDMGVAARCEEERSR